MSSSYVIWILATLLLLTSLFMILLVLIQRGRGGGLAGAFGGMGGQSAFGTRAGDVFTKITVVVAVVFILVASLLGKSMRAHQRDVDAGKVGPFQGGANVESAESDSEDQAPPVMDAVGEDDSSEKGDKDESEATSGDGATEQSDDSTAPATGEVETTNPAESSPEAESSETPDEDSATE